MPSSDVAGWQDLTEYLPKGKGWMHSGIAVNENGLIYCAHPEGNALIAINPSGDIQIIQSELTEHHSIQLCSQGSELAIADPGHRMYFNAETSDYEGRQGPGRAAIINSNTGKINLELAKPKISSYEELDWSPTSIAVDDSLGGTSEIWVADGYATSLIHKYSAQGEYLFSVDGEDSGTKFDCPHGIAILREGNTFYLYVADRTNHRIVVLNESGDFVNAFGGEILDSPSSIVRVGNHIFVTELFGGVSVFSLEGDFIRTLEKARTRKHNEACWPNSPDEQGLPIKPEVSVGGFNSPHGICEHNGRLYITEWFIGGRLESIDPKIF